ncbi:hypothetical protein CVT26_014921 [Gymnopilus dilepis]|uniref:Uncharacterized protein n=1 Tax=Gymnopilus dilepis TaxID=231916 RepID=A0A409XWX4_9AGAR|nr:hypothetical protein CVT26_014921 [Gymnopilus dilepis]
MPPAAIPLSDDQLFDWFRSGSSITDDDVPLIVKSIEYHEDRLDSLNIQISSILDPAPLPIERSSGFCGLSFGRKAKKTPDEPAELKQLHALQDASHVSLYILDSALAPIRRLPPEILSEIFRFCLPNTRFHRPSPSRAPLLLTQVCCSWRKICISTPSLWTSLEIGKAGSKSRNAPQEHSAMGDIVPALVNTWFSRAGDCPLSFSVQENNLLIKEVAQTLERYGSRWLHLKIHAPKAIGMLLHSKIDYRNLESLEVQVVEELEDAAIDELSAALLKAPRFHHFVWDNAGRRASGIELPWERLTRLTLNGGVEIDRCLTIITNLKEITHLTFQHIMISTTAVANLKVTLPELTSLVICSEFPLGVFVFEAITAPRLKELVINLKTWPHDSIMGFLRRSKCPLESLNLYFARVTEPELVECLECVQSTLKEFTVQGAGGHERIFTDSLLARLSYQDNPNVLCPHVVVIALYQCIECTTGRFAEMISSRLSPPYRSAAGNSEHQELAPLRVVEMYDEEADFQGVKDLRSLGLILKLYSFRTRRELPMQPEELDRLRRLKEEGLVLRVYHATTGHFGEADY